MITSRKMLGVAAAAAMAPVGVVVAGCGGSSSAAAPTTTPPATTTVSPPATTTATTPAASQTVDVTADPTGKLEFVQKALTAKAGAIDFKLTNASPVPHNVAIEQGTTVLGTSTTIDSNASTDLTVTLKPGRTKFHRGSRSQRSRHVRHVDGELTMRARATASTNATVRRRRGGARSGRVRLDAGADQFGQTVRESRDPLAARGNAQEP